MIATLTYTGVSSGNEFIMSFADGTKLKGRLPTPEQQARRYRLILDAAGPAALCVIGFYHQIA